MLSEKPLLIAEDDANDVFLLQRACERAGVTSPLVIAKNGQEAIDYLRGAGPYANGQQHPFPAMMFLDLKMPLVDGFDVLNWLSTQPPEKKLPVVVLTSSNQERDVAEARRLGAVDFRVKPHESDELTQIVRELCQRWINGCHSNGKR